MYTHTHKDTHTGQHSKSFNYKRGQQGGWELEEEKNDKAEEKDKSFNVSINEVHREAGGQRAAQNDIDIWPRPTLTAYFAVSTPIK